jgi:hypothetical protein
MYTYIRSNSCRKGKKCGCYESAVFDVFINEQIRELNKRMQYHIYVNPTSTAHRKLLRKFAHGGGG